MIWRIDISDDLVDALDTSRLESLLGEGALSPEEARRSQGNVVLAFPGYADEQAIYLVPKLRAYLQAAHERVPHLLYYLAPEQEAGSVIAFLGAHADEGQLVYEPEPGVRIDRDLIMLLADRLAFVALFSDRLADNTPAIVSALVAPFDEAIASELRDFALDAARELG